MIKYKVFSIWGREDSCYVGILLCQFYIYNESPLYHMEERLFTREFCKPQGALSVPSVHEGVQIYFIAL